MNDTPETDAKIICSTHRSFKGVGGVVVSEFARRLERERDEARELAQQMSESNQVLMADVRFYRNAWEQLNDKLATL